MTVSRRLLALLVVLAVAASGCSVLGIGRAGTYEVSAQFARTYNLFPDSPVRVLGVEVGKVKELHVSPGSDVVTADLVIHDHITLPADVGAVIIPSSLLGERYVQLFPPYEAGPAAQAGMTIPRERTIVPAEFDEVLESLNTFVGTLDEGEVARLITNLADVLEGNGETLGDTIDNAEQLIGVLRENDDDIITLASRLSDLNETLASRDQALGAIIEDWNTVARSLADDRGDIDAALRGLVRITESLGAILVEHRPELEADVASLTRVARTANRNLDGISLGILSSAELFRHAERVVSRTHNWLPLVNHSEGLEEAIAESIAARLRGICLNAGVDPDRCDQIRPGQALATRMCLPPLVNCPDDLHTDAPTPTVGEALREVLEEMPELAEALDDRSDGSSPDDVGRDLLGSRGGQR